MKTRLLVLLYLGVFWPVMARASIPSILNFQGRVTVTNVPFTGTGQFKFALVNTNASLVYWGNSTDSTPADGIPDQSVSLAVNRGVYSVLLGDTNVANMAALPASVFDNSDVALRVWFNDGSHGFEQLSPDQRLAAAGYALRALSAEQVSGAIAASQLPPNVPLKDANQTFGGINRFTNSANSYVGSGSGLTQLPATSLTGALTVAPGQPFGIGHADESGGIAGAAFGVAILDNFVYLANDTGGLRIYSVTNPASPQLIGAVFDAGSAESLVVTNTFAYVANYDDGFRVYDVSDPTTPTSVGNIKDGSFTWGVAVAGHFAYVANFDDGLRVYDVSNPTALTRVGHVNNGGNAYSVVVAGQYAYLANDTDGLRIYDISTPANPTSVGHINDGGPGANAFGIAVAGHYAYLANGRDGLRIYDVTNPALPVDIGHIDPAVFAFSVTVVNNYAFVANDTDGLRIYDVTNPANPFNIGHVNDGSSNSGAAEAVAVANNRVYLANGPDGLRIYGYGVVRAGLKVGIGRDPATNALEVEGEASKTTAGGWLANSDARIKTDIRTVADALNKLDLVRLVSFRYTDEYRAAHPTISDRPYLNVVAQEFQRTFPEYVRNSGEKLPDGSPILQVDSWPLMVYAAAAVQELHRQELDQKAAYERETRQKDLELQNLRDRVLKLEQLVDRLGNSPRSP